MDSVPDPWTRRDLLRLDPEPPLPPPPPSLHVGLGPTDCSLPLPSQGLSTTPRSRVPPGRGIRAPSSDRRRDCVHVHSRPGFYTGTPEGRTGLVGLLFGPDPPGPSTPSERPVRVMELFGYPRSSHEVRPTPGSAPPV